MSGAVATEEDVKAGRAVFYFSNLDEVPAWPAETKIPALVLWRDGETGAAKPAVLIQAEQSAIQCTAGVRFLVGGNGVALLNDLEFVREDDPRVLGSASKTLAGPVMLPTYDVLPHCGIGPLRLGMARAEARRCMPTPPTEFRKTPTGPWVDAWHECGFQAFYSDAGTIEFLEVSRGAVDAQLRGIRVFDTDADEVVRRLRAEADIDEDDPESPYSYVFPGWDLTLWRQIVPEDQADTEGRLFDTVGVGILGYYSKPPS